MAIDKSTLEYRKSAQALIIKNNKILITQEVQWKDNEWGFPGGQIEKGEIPEQTALRELMEEFPKNTFRILKRSKNPIKYDWPDEIIEGDIRIKGWSYRGQIREQFLAELNENDIFEVKSNELKAHKWVSISELKKYLIFPNQFENTMQTLIEFGVNTK